MPAASSARDSDLSVQQLLAEWQARAARGEQLDAAALLAALEEATSAAAPRPADPRQTVALPGNQAPTVSIRPPSHASDSPSAAFERLSSRLKALARSAEGSSAKAGIADYDLLREIAHGGMGIVYEARQKSLNRVVALKMIRAGELADAEDVARFFAEAEAAANLRHPNIVAVHEFGRAGDSGEHHYFTMDFVAGPSLLEVVRKQPLDPREAASQLAKIARAIQFAHDRGVLHRDLKPANILLGEGGEPLVTDFGLAKRIGVDSGVTIAGTVLGTPSYMPPEQASGNLNQVGPHSDVYSLGAVLYECLTGRPPFISADAMEVFRQVIQDEPVPPSRLSPKLPRDLETICLKCLQKDKQRRYASAAALADDLERFLRGEPILARPVGFVERTIKWARRRPAVAALYGVLAAAALAVLGVAGFYNHKLASSNAELSSTVSQLGVALNDATTQRTKATEQSQLAIDRLRAERRNAYATVIQRAEDYWQESPPNILRARELLASLVPRENDEDLRGVEWYLLSRMCNADEERMLHGAGTIKELAVRADGRALAFRETGFNPYLEWIDADGKAGRQSIRGEALPALMRFSKQSDWVATRSAGGRIELRNRLTPEKVEAEVQAKSEELAEIAISDDGQWIAWCTWPGQYGLWNVATRQLEFEDQLSKVDVAIRRILISPDGNWLAMFGIRDVYFVNRQKRQQSYQVHSNSSSNITALAFASDSKLFAISHNDGEIQTFAVPPQRTALRRFNTLKLTVRPESLEFLPSGDLAVGASNGLLIVMDVKEGKTRTFRGHTETISCLAASPDGRWLYSGSLRGEVLRWDPSLTDQRATLIAGAKKPTDEMMAYYCADYSPDGRWLAVGGQWLTFDDAPASGEIVLADASTGKIVRRIATPQGVAACRFTIDGKGLIYGTARALTPGQFWLAEMPALDRPREIALSGRKLFAAAPLADGNIALASGDATVRLWSPKTGAEVGQWQPAATRGPHQATEMFSIIAAKGGHHALAHGEGGLVRLWESPGGRDVLVAPATIGHEPLAISSDGRLVAWPAANPDIRQSLAYEGVTIAPGIPWYSDWEERAIVYDSQQQQMRMGVLGHSRGLTAMAFSADSRRLATGDGRGEVKLWDTETGYELLTFDAHTNDVFAIAFHPSGRQMATVGADGLVRIWPRK